MASIHDEGAAKVIAALAREPAPAGQFREALDRELAAHSNGDAHHRIKVAKALHEALPEPYCRMPFSTSREPPEPAQVMAGVHGWLDQPGRTPEEIAAWLEAADRRAQQILAD